MGSSQQSSARCEHGIRPHGKVDDQHVRVGLARGLRELPHLRWIQKNRGLDGITIIPQPADGLPLLLDKALPLLAHILPSLPQRRDGHNRTVHFFPLHPR